MTTHEDQTLPASQEQAQVPETPEPRAASAVPSEPAVSQEQHQSQPGSSAPAEATAPEFSESAGHERRPAVASPDSVQPEPESAAASPQHASLAGESSTDETLFATDDLTELRGRWAAVQAGFVDDPRECVQKADGLVSDVVNHLTAGFGQARSRLEEQWARGEQASTEDLRLALMHYREFFERLLAV